MKVDVDVLIMIDFVVSSFMPSGHGFLSVFVMTYFLFQVSVHINVINIFFVVTHAHFCCSF